MRSSIGSVTASRARMRASQASLRTADLIGLGIGPDELSGPRWRNPFRGVHTPAVGDPAATAQRILDVVELIPAGGALSGWAAAHLLGASELDGRGRSGRAREDVLITVPRGCHLSRRVGVRYVRSRLEDDDVVEVGGIVVTGPVRTTFDLARASTVENGLVAADRLCRQLGLSPARVLIYVEQHPRFRGVPVARAVLELADPRSRSGGESRLRYLWVVVAGLPRPQCNPYVVDAEGTVVAMADLLDDGCGLAGEYDGSTHRELGEHTADNVREEDLEGLGLVVVRATSLDLGRFRSRTVARILQGRERATATTSRSWGWRPSPLRPPNPRKW